MGYVRADGVDLYISYARVDDQSLAGGPGWVTTFVGHLRNLLARRLGRTEDISVEFGNNLLGDVGSVRSIEGSIGASALFLAFLSPGYLSSKWCRTEAEMLLRRTQDGDRQRPPLFLVEVVRIANEDLPPEFLNLLRVPFWTADRDRPELVRQLGYPRPDPASPEDRPYFQRLNGLAYDLADELKRRRAEEATRVLPELDSPRPQTVFLAEATDDIEDARDSVRGYLVQMGYGVLPRRVFTNEEGPFRAEVGADLAESSLFIQLLGTSPGRRLGGSETWRVQVQHECALELRVPVLQWRSRSLDAANVTHPGLRAMLQGPDVIACDLEEFKSLVARRIQQLLTPLPLGSPVEVTGPLVLVDAEPADMGLAREIGKVLSGAGAWCAFPPHLEEPSRSRREMEQNFVDCDALLLVRGADPHWVESRLLLYRKLQARRDLPLRSIVVYEGPSAEPSELNMMIPGLLVINGRSGPSAGQFDRFLKAQATH